MRAQGRISDWRDGKGYGFITPDAGGERVFVHVKAFSGRAARPVGGERVSYRLATDIRGRPRAVQVAYAAEGDRVQRATQRDVSRAGVFRGIGLWPLLAGVSLASFGYLLLASARPDWLLLAYAAMSVFAFALYALDKSAARAGRWRIQESTLHSAALLGGWPGAVMAQRLLRHKSRKPSFQVVFWLTVTINLGALWWLSTPAGELFFGLLR
ncbi:MAG: DUF1294 domain-containing protein [Xanthomonadaceae bacterium]|nr:DUF1294 domain-containing protein [Xanthomonadaceae bacterium]